MSEISGVPRSDLGYGKEFALHERIAQALQADFYFAHPYASWGRGLNENTNGLIRQYFLKNRDFSTITDTEIHEVMSKLNNRPRKCLSMKRPNQVFFGINPPVALASRIRSQRLIAYKILIESA